MKRKREELEKLTPEEKGYLIEFVLNKKNTVYVGLEDGIMGGLVAKRIAYRAANAGNLLDGFAFNLQPWARDYLEKNPHVLDGYKGGPMTPREKFRPR